MGPGCFCRKYILGDHGFLNLGPILEDHRIYFGKVPAGDLSQMLMLLLPCPVNHGPTHRLLCDHSYLLYSGL